MNEKHYNEGLIQLLNIIKIIIYINRNQFILTCISLEFEIILVQSSSFFIVMSSKVHQKLHYYDHLSSKKTKKVHHF
jgi:hypothetical protein